VKRLTIPSETITLGLGTKRLATTLLVLGIAGLALAGLLAQMGEDGTPRFFRAYLVNFVYFLSLALGALFFVLISHLTRAGWNVSLRRVAEASTFTFVPLAVLALLLIPGLHDLYEWTHHEVVEKDPILSGKAAYLNVPFFLARLALYFLAWNAIAHYFRRRSVEQDATGRPEITVRMELRSAPAMIVFALTLTFAIFDLVMSLYPHWYSTIFGVYYFAGAVLGFFALLPILTAILQRRGLLRRVVTAEHYHDLGKLMFAFVVFWAYIGFSQYMLIWYGNLPEETVFYLRRQSGPWAALSLVLLFGHFFVPFFALMSRHPKRRLPALLAAAAWILLMHWLDLYWLVMPEASPHALDFRLVDVACFLGIGGIFFSALVWRLRKHDLIPVRDPRLAEAVAFENA
jgi:hypothetical protein